MYFEKQTMDYSHITILELKWYGIPIAFSISSQGLNQCQMKAHIFLIITPKFQVQIHFTLEVIAENVPISGIPILIFLCIFVTASSPVRLLQNIDISKIIDIKKILNIQFSCESNIKISKFWYYREPQVGKTSVLTWIKLHKCPCKVHHVNEC